MQQVASDLVKVEDAIEVCEHDIRTIERKVEQIEEELSKRELSSTDVAYWRKKEEQLRKKKEQLRKKEEQLRKKEEQLRKKEELLLRPGNNGGTRSAALCAFAEFASQLNLNGTANDLGMHAFEAEDGERLTLLGDAAEDTFQGQLFVRDCYPPLLQQILSAPCTMAGSSHARRPRAFSLSGTPGIGKSAFGIYSATVLLAKKRTVLFQVADQVAYKLHWNGERAEVLQYEMPSHNLEWRTLVRECTEEGAWYIVDSIRPLRCGLPTLLVSSPNPKVSKEWVKQRQAAELWMPMPLAQDIRRLRDYVAPSMTDDDVDARLSMVGKSARLVLSPVSTERSLSAQVDEAVTQMPLDIYERRLHVHDPSRELSHRLVHHDVHRPQKGEKWDFSFYRLRFASDEVETRIATRVAEMRGDKLWQLVNTQDAWRWMPTARGTLFEAIVLSRLARGDIMCTRLIDGGEESERCFSHSEERRFTALADIDLSTDVLWVPRRGISRRSMRSAGMVSSKSPPVSRTK